MDSVRVILYTKAEDKSFFSCVTKTYTRARLNTRTQTTTMPTLLWLHVLTPVVLSGLVNAHIYISNKGNTQDVVRKQQQQQSDLLPPGYVIGIVWTIIFALLGYAHYRVFPSLASFVIVAALAYCLTYPYLTMFRSARFRHAAKFLNTLSLIIAALVVAATVAKDTVAFVACLPLLAWASYVNLVDAIECQQRS